MRCSRSKSLLTITLALLVGVAASVSAQSRGGQGHQDGPPPEPPRQHREDDALSDAVRRIERNNRGQVLSAERMQYDGREVSRIKVIDDDGRVRIYMDEPQHDERKPSRDERSRGEPPRSRKDDD